MTDLRKAAEMALKALESLDCGDTYKTHNAASALRQALAQPEQETFTLDRGCWERGCVAYDERDGDGVNISAERVDETAKGEHEPVAWMVDNDGNKYEIPEANKGPLLKAMERKWVRKQSRRKWVGLTDEEKYDVLEGATGDGGRVYYDALFRSYEAKLKEKNAND